MASTVKQRKSVSKDMKETKTTCSPLSAHGAPTPKFQRHAMPPRRPTRSVHITVSLFILGFFVLYAHRKGITPPKKPYTPLGKQLPSWYAVCSREGKRVYTVPAAGGLGAVECVVVGGNKVVDSGSLAHVRRNWGDKATIGAVDQSPEHIRAQGGITVVYLPAGHTLTPGFIDAHAHPLEYGHSRQLQLVGCKSIAEVISRVEEYVKNNPLPVGSWIEGLGWDQNLWDAKTFPTADDLDASPVLHGLPIALKRIDVHAEWVSHAILESLGTLPTEVEGGQIVRDELGNPTGVFVDNAIDDILNRVRPAWSDAQREEYLDIVGRDALAHGLVGVHDAGVSPHDISFFRRMADEGKLPIRFYTMLLCDNREAYCGDEVERVDGAADGRWTLRSVKLFGDGALGSRGAALLDDYTDQPGWKGFLLTKEDIWKPLIKKFYDAGWQVNVHCIGDRANHVVLNAMEEAIGADKPAGRARRLRIEHAQIMTQDDLKRAAQMGVIGSYQPTHATSDMWYAEDRLGSERIQGAYAWRTYLEHGGRLALGSDFPVESLDPLKGFYAAVTRRGEDGTSPHGPTGWYPGQKLSRLEALRGFTVDPAYASFSNSTGSLTPGMRFDAVVWDDDLMTVDEDEMLEVKVAATLLDGRLVYGSWQV